MLNGTFTLLLNNLPFQAGGEVIILVPLSTSTSQNRYPRVPEGFEKVFHNTTFLVLRFTFN